MERRYEEFPLSITDISGTILFTRTNQFSRKNIKTVITRKYDTCIYEKIGLKRIAMRELYLRDD